jgi:SAM-dependent methyltransferase
MRARLAIALAGCVQLACSTPANDDLPHARFEPTPPEIVVAMLDLAAVGERDVVYDLGSGDGRIVIAAALRGARGVGVELSEELVATSREEAESAGVAERVRFVRQDLFEADIRPATVVTLYLLPQVNLALRPKLLRELAPGTRIVSHSHDMGDWQYEAVRQVRDVSGKTHVLYRWTVPARGT